MDILINGERIDVTLEEEKTVGDVVDGVQKWILDSGFLITAIRKDGVALNVENTVHWAALPLEGVEHLGFTAITPSELLHARFLELRQYVSDFLLTLQEADARNLSSAAAEYPSYEPYLLLLLGGADGSEPRPAGERNVSEPENEHAIIAFLRTFTAGIEAGAADPQRYEMARTALGQILLLLSERIREVENPLQELRATLKCLSETVPAISDVSILLQTGKDREAMANVIRFTELSAKLLRLYPILTASGSLNTNSISVDGNSFEEYYTDFNRVLMELLEAFRAQDSVLIGDLLEYEIAPRIDRFLAAASN